MGDLPYDLAFIQIDCRDGGIGRLDERQALDGQATAATSTAGAGRRHQQPLRLHRALHRGAPGRAEANRLQEFSPGPVPDGDGLSSRSRRCKCIIRRCPRPGAALPNQADWREAGIARVGVNTVCVSGS